MTQSAMELSSLPLGTGFDQPTSQIISAPPAAGDGAWPPPLTENEKRTHAAQAYPSLLGQTIGQPQSELVAAVNTVARAVSARIAVLQAEIDALRKALQPFQHMGKQAPGDAFSVDGNDAVTELLNIARKLGGSGA